MIDDYHTLDVSSTAFYKAIEKKYEAEIAECSATLEVYFTNVVGIGEHSDIITEIDKYIEKMATAADKLETLRKAFGPNT